MASNDSGEKTEKPTPKKLKEGRKQGQVARAPDVIAWVGVLVVSMLIPGLISKLGEAMAGTLEHIGLVVEHPEPGLALRALGEMAAAAVAAMVPILAAVMIVGVVGGAAQGGARPYATRIKPKGARLNVFSSAKRMFGMQGLWELVKQLLKTALIGLLVWQAVTNLVPLVMGSGALPLTQIIATVANALITMVRTIAVAALVIAAADYFVSWRRTRKQLMMSRKEIKDEYKQQEGDPMVKSQIRQRAMAMSRNRMMAEVADADVVLVNPTHVSVALKYSPGRGAPRVVAKGAGVLAKRIRELAAENRVPVVEDIPLARGLYAACELGDEIPPELYTAVAKVLAFVMALRQRGTHAGIHRSGELAMAAAVARR